MTSDRSASLNRYNDFEKPEEKMEEIEIYRHRISLVSKRLE